MPESTPLEIYSNIVRKLISMYDVDRKNTVILERAGQLSGICLHLSKRKNGDRVVCAQRKNPKTFCCTGVEFILDRMGELHMRIGELDAGSSDGEGPASCLSIHYHRNGTMDLCYPDTYNLNENGFPAKCYNEKNIVANNINMIVKRPKLAQKLYGSYFHRIFNKYMGEVKYFGSEKRTPKTKDNGNIAHEI